MKAPSYLETLEAISNDSFSSWPTKTQKMGLLSQNASQTPLHYAAANNLLPNIPKPLLTEKLLLKKNYYGDTPFDEAAMHGDLLPLRNCLPLKTIEKLLQSKNTPHQAIPFLKAEKAKRQALADAVHKQTHPAL
jgi:hypothetical protein